MTGFNKMVLVIDSDEQGTLIDAQLGLGGEMVDSKRRIVPGRPGTNILNSRIRKAIRELVSGAFPRVEAPAAEPTAPATT